MNDEAERGDSLDELSGDLRAAVDCLKQRPVPDEAMQRALDRAARYGSHTQPMARPWGLKVLFGFAAAAAVCLAIGLWLSQPSNLWADVVMAVQAKPWIHGTLRTAKSDQSREFWISTSRAVGGARSAEQISFFDNRLQITYRYEPQRKILYRLPATATDLGQGEQLLEIFQGLFRGDAELKASLPGLILKDQKRMQTEKERRKWDEYELQFQIPSRPDADLRMTFLVDAQTRLPHSMTMKGQAGESVEWTFDYPETGPADIYGLGVPRDARLDDRVPKGDLARILSSIEAGRDRFDDFFAIVVRDSSSELSNPQHPRPIPTVYLVWKKGDRWRVEIAVAPASLVRDGVPSVEDKMAWLRDVCKETVFMALNVCDGKRVYEGEMPGKNFGIVGTVDQASWCPEAMRAMPGMWCYPPTFPMPNDRTEEVVETKPSGGPPNTILVTSRLVDVRGHDPARTLRFQRYWLDPTRGYSVVRKDIFRDDPAVKPSTDPAFQDLMDQWEQTPSGIWYPRRVNEGSGGGRWYHFFLDFHADLPDDLFKPRRRSVLTDRYPVGS